MDTLLRSYHVRKSNTLGWKYLILKAKLKNYHDLSNGERSPWEGESPGVLHREGLGAWMFVASLNRRLTLCGATQSHWSGKGHMKENVNSSTGQLSGPETLGPGEGTSPVMGASDRAHLHR